MTDDDKKVPPLPPVMLGGWVPPGREGQPPLPYKTIRPKRRRNGQLNDGQWAPGYGPGAKKNVE